MTKLGKEKLLLQHTQSHELAYVISRCFFLFICSLYCLKRLLIHQRKKTFLQITRSETSAGRGISPFLTVHSTMYLVLSSPSWCSHNRTNQEEQRWNTPTICGGNFLPSSHLPFPLTKLIKCYMCKHTAERERKGREKEETLLLLLPLRSPPRFSEVKMGVAQKHFDCRRPPAKKTEGVEALN